MAGYRRFVAYVYEYRKGKKENNCGFIKVEVRDSRCRMEMHLQCPGLTPGAKCRVYGFVRNGGLMEGYLLGQCETAQGRADGIFETDSGNMGGSGISLNRMGGMIIRTESGAFFGTEWDDQKVRPENFKEMEPTSAGEEKGEPGREEKGAKAREPKKAAESAPEPERETGEERVEESESEKEGAPERMPEREEAGQEGTPEPKSEKEGGPEMMPERGGETGQERAEESDREGAAEILPEDREGGNEEVRAEEAESIDSSGGEDAAGKEQETPEKAEAAQEKEPELESQSVQNMTEAVETGGTVIRQEERAAAKTEVFLPFDDEEISECTKIHPKDLMHILRRDCALRNNRFLQYGYYNFGHLLLGKRPNGQYILGVPGGYDQQERFMANMFGFPYFKESRQIQLPKGRGGYWYRLINAPDPNQRNGAKQDAAKRI